jgi:hypothetical protein
MKFAMKKRAVVAGILVTMTTPLVAEEDIAAQEFTEMVGLGDVGLDFRYRYEYVDDGNFDRDAKASTLRSRLTFESASYKGFDFLVEFDNVAYVGDDKFNSTTNGKTQYPVVADPKGTEVNQAWLRYSWEELYGAYGRQRILHGNQRFVGGVAWRQNEQTYDGFRAEWQGTSGLSLDYAYVHNVNRIFGPDDSVAQPANWKGSNHLFRVDWKFLEHHTLTGFIYALDIDERGRWSPNKSVNNSTDTYGVEYGGKFGPFGLRASYASQSDAGDSYLDYDADYYVVEGSLDFLGIKGTLGYEVLGSDNGVGFKTPLATLHKFQGWADKFLITPGDGIEDAYLSLFGKLGPVKLGGVYHDFQAEDSSADFGTELDLVATWPINSLWSVQLKYASFNSDDKARYSDTDKAWLTVNLKL